MRITSLLATAFIVFMISMLIFKRDILVGVFTGTPEERAERSLIEEYNEKSKEIQRIENDINAKQEALESTKKSLTEAEESLDVIEAKLEGEGEDIAALETAFEKSEGPQPISVVVRHSIAASMQDGVTLSGNAEAAKQIDVRAETAGTLTGSPITKGQRVEIGDVLCQLDDGARGANVAQAKANLDAALVQVETARKLAQNGLTSRAATRSAEAQLAQAQAALAQAQEEANRTTITAPIAGVVDSTPLEAGDFLQAGGVCATIVDPDAMKLVGYITETQLDSVRIGAVGGARLKNGENLLGRVSSIAETADPTTLTYRVEIDIPFANNQIRSGASADLYIAVEGTEGHLLPQNVITLSDEGEVGVRIAEPVDDGFVAAFQPVKVLRTDDLGMWLGGLPHEVDVIIVGQEYATDGREIEITFETSPTDEMLDEVTQ